VQHVRWEPAAGRLSHHFDDDLVCASVGVHPALLRGIEPFPTGELKAYDAGFVAGWIVERYQIDLIAAAQRSRETMDAKVRSLCGQQVPGDTFRNLNVQADYSAQTFKHILAPVWLLSYTYGTRAFQCVMNGVTGTVRGEYPKSPWKVALLVVAILVGVLCSCAGRAPLTVRPDSRPRAVVRHLLQRACCRSRHPAGQGGVASGARLFAVAGGSGADCPAQPRQRSYRKEAHAARNRHRGLPRSW
jgi:hypothetical protein